MSDPFIAEIRIMACPFPPVGWAWCDGQILSIAQNTALFSLLGTTYGGDGTRTFALPNLQGRAPMNAGQGPGLTERVLGEEGGEATVTISQAEIPAHTHPLLASNQLGDTAPVTGAFLARTSFNLYQNVTNQNVVPMSDAALLPATGGGQPHNNMQPYLALYFNIALQGLFPQRG